MAQPPSNLAILARLQHRAVIPCLGRENRYRWMPPGRLPAHATRFPIVHRHVPRHDGIPGPSFPCPLSSLRVPWRTCTQETEPVARALRAPEGVLGPQAEARHRCAVCRGGRREAPGGSPVLSMRGSRHSPGRELMNRPDRRRTTASAQGGDARPGRATAICKAHEAEPQGWHGIPRHGLT